MMSVYSPEISIVGPSSLGGGDDVDDDGFSYVGTNPRSDLVLLSNTVELAVLLLVGDGIVSFVEVLLVLVSLTILMVSLSDVIVVVLVSSTALLVEFAYDVLLPPLMTSSDNTGVTTTASSSSSLLSFDEYALK